MNMPVVPMRKIILLRNDRFGEFLLNIPAMRAVKETFPAARLHVAVAAGVAELARAVSVVDEVMICEPQSGSWLEEVKLVWQLHREKYDAAIVLNPSARAHRLVYLAGIPLRVGYARKHAFFLTRTRPDVKDQALKHEVEYNLDLAALLGCSTSNKMPELTVPVDVERHVIRKWGLDRAAGLVAVHPWTSDPLKQWPLGNFERLVTALAREHSRRVVMIGRAEAWQQGLSVPALPGIIDLCGRTTLLEAAAVLKQCAMLVSGDSGPVHLAASVGTPVIALFRNDIPGKTPQRWGPYGRGHVVIQKPRLEDITVEEVLTRIL